MWAIDMSDLIWFDFIEIAAFTQTLVKLMPDTQYAEVQREILANPEVGTVMPGCGGMRKMRAEDQDRSKGKRGGYRIIYLNVPEAQCVFMIAIYGKNTKENLTQDDKHRLKAAAVQLKKDAIARYKRWFEGTK